MKKIGNTSAGTLNFDQNTIRRVAHETCQVETLGEVINKRAKAHTLDNTMDLDSLSIPFAQRIPSAV